MIVALLYFATAILLLWLAGKFVTAIRGVAAICLLLIPLCFTGRALLRGRVYAPVDMAYMTFPLWGYRGEFGIGEPERPIFSDIAFQILPWREATRRAVMAGEWPLLNRFMMCGDILAATAQPAPFSPFTWIALLVAAPVSFTFSGSIAFFVAALGTFLFLRDLQCSEMAALSGAATFALSGPIALQILWPLGFSWTFLPFVLLGIRRRSIGLLAVALTLLALAGHPETLFHIVVIAGAYALFEMFDRRLKPAPHVATALAGAGLLALLLSSIALLPFLEAAPQTMEHFLRDEIFSKLPFRAPPGHARAALLSNLFPFARAGFGMRLAQGSEAGSIALALAIYGLFAGKSRQRWFFVPLLLVCLLAGARAWPVAHLLHRLPLFDIALNERLASAVPLCIAVLAALGLDCLGLRRLAAALIFAGMFVVLSIGALVLRPVNVPLLVAELAPLAVAALVVNFRKATPLLLGLVLVQRTMADGALVPVHRPEVAYPQIALFEPLKRIRDPFRIVATDGTLIPNNATMYGLEDVRGSTAMNLLLMEETNPLWCRQTGLGFQQVDDLTRPFLSMMNVRFALTRASDAIPNGWREVTVDHGTRLVENAKVLPRAFIPKSVRIASPPGADIEEMQLVSNFADSAWIEGRGVPQELANGPGTVSIRRAKLGYELDAAMQREGWVVISQASWKGWRAWVDGRPAEVRRANHAFLAVHLPQGKHRVKLTYLPRSFVWGGNISAATLIGLVLLGVAKRRR